MTSIGDDIRGVFGKGRSSSVKLIFINAFVFIGFSVLTFLLKQFENTNNLGTVIDQNLLLHASLIEFLTHPWTLLIFGFSNASILNLLVTGLMLFWFGNLVEEYIGRLKVYSVYITGYLFAGLFYVFTFGLIQYTNANLNLLTLVSGASAGVYALMFAAITLLPEYEFYLFRRFYVKVKYIALLLLVISFLSPSVGILNLGGAMLGYLYVKMLRVGVDLGAPVETIFGWFKSKSEPPRSFIKRSYSHSTVAGTRGFTVSAAEQSYVPDQEEVDALLDKISKSGYNSLSKIEKERLHLASKK